MRILAEPAAEADRGRHPGFARHEGLAGGPGSLSLSLCKTRHAIDASLTATLEPAYRCGDLADRREGGLGAV